MLASYLNKRKQETADFTQHAPLLCVPAVLSTSFCCFFARTNPQERNVGMVDFHSPHNPPPALCRTEPQIMEPQLRREIRIIPGRGCDDAAVRLEVAHWGGKNDVFQLLRG